ncbi:carbon starvation protein A [Cuneatibacter sp. NSJ-177]|uniref:carbon starvation CstA family protein n=1 Tax=Cuneatibacter sp. NSJ-177 TaxID=2931401 RepID=UPI001FD0F887|nr:carbon starvation CstA family protein [Cuneatibacter sp. NSJ-177]MCJ7833819.1 carbon starvation protein A [Cuneatibacter sp. NSJ-177]
MITFFVCLALLIVGYLVYGAIVEKVFHPDERQTPCVAHPDGVDYVPMKPWRSFLIQLLNIAGLGPIFGALSGAIWGPSVYLWIVFGTIFAGGVHDYLSGMLSERNNGASISEIVGIYLGPVMKTVMRIFSVVLLVMVGVVFMVGPAGLLALLTPGWMSVKFWTIVVLIYYFLATLLPIDKIIGKLYPIFGVCLIVMALGIAGSTVLHNGTRPMLELTLQNLHPDGKPIWPLMFITVACGAISGFHATQSPMIARCITQEKQGRKIFYGAMVAEGVIALIWASAGVAFYYTAGDGMAALNAAGGGNSTVVYQMSMDLLGPIGGVLAMIGVIACPITSGDTAFRSARLTLADWFQIDQKSTKKRLFLSIPLLGIGYLISLVDYQVIWRYFSWSNQTLAMIALWAGAVYLCRFVNKKASFMAALPATFMSAVSMTYILYAEEGLNFGSKGMTNTAYVIGIVFAVACLALFLFRCVCKKEELKTEG